MAMPQAAHGLPPVNSFTHTVSNTSQKQSEQLQTAWQFLHSKGFIRKFKFRIWSQDRFVFLSRVYNVLNCLFFGYLACIPPAFLVDGNKALGESIVRFIMLATSCIFMSWMITLELLLKLVCSQEFAEALDDYKPWNQMDVQREVLIRFTQRNPRLVRSVVNEKPRNISVRMAWAMLTFLIILWTWDWESPLSLNLEFLGRMGCLFGLVVLGWFLSTDRSMCQITGVFSSQQIILFMLKLKKIKEFTEPQRPSQESLPSGLTEPLLRPKWQQLAIEYQEMNSRLTNLWTKASWLLLIVLMRYALLIMLSLIGVLLTYEDDTANNVRRIVTSVLLTLAAAVTTAAQLAKLLYELASITEMCISTVPDSCSIKSLALACVRVVGDTEFAEYQVFLTCISEQVVGVKMFGSVQITTNLLISVAYPTVTVFTLVISWLISQLGLDLDVLQTK